MIYRHGTYRGKQEWEILWMNTDTIPKKAKVLEISDETWNSGEGEGGRTPVIHLISSTQNLPYW